LLALPRQEWAAIRPKLQFVSLPRLTLLNEVAKPIEFAFFLNEGLASVLTVMANGKKSVEVGLSGREGFVGVPLTVGFSSSSARVIMQVAGSGFRMAAKDLVSALGRCPILASRLRRFAHEMALQSAQVAACNQLHAMEARLAKFLLMCQDRSDANLITLTQRSLADMMGSRRATVTVAAGILQKAGLITYKRGCLKIEKRDCLEEAACECYQLLAVQLEKWRFEARCEARLSLAG
jgi:CRP-like cAMP-binding protein